MSIVTKSKNHDLPVSYCHSETESELSSDSQSFEEFGDREGSKDHSPRRNSTNIFESTQEIEDTDISTNELVPSRKRRRDRSSSEESQGSSRSCSVSPEITYGGSPVKYKLCRVDGTLLVIKKSMSSTPRKRPQKCTDHDITTLLDSDSDLEIFDPPRKTGYKIVGKLPSDSSNKSCTPSKSEILKRDEVSLRIKLRRSTEQSNYKIEPNFDLDETKCRTSRRSTKGTPKKCGMIDCDEDHSDHGIQRTLKSPNISNVKKTESPSTRRTRRNSKTETPETKNLHNKENESELDNDSVEENDGSASRTKKSSSKRDFGTPVKQSKKLEEVDIPRSARLRRNSRLVNYNYDALENMKEYEEKKETPKKKVPPAAAKSARARRNTRLLSYDYDDVEKPNYKDKDSDNEADINDPRGKKQLSAKSITETPEKKIIPSTPRSTRARKSTRSESYDYDENDSNEEDNDVDLKDSGKMSRRKSEAKLIGTPRKQIKKIDESITPSSRPRRNSRLVNYNYDGLDSPEIKDRENEMAQDDAVPRRPGTRRYTSKEGSATPQKQIKISEEPSTPKRTPRKSAAQRLGEATPMRTPRRSTMKQINEEPPRTPTTASKRISKATTPSLKNGSLTPSMTRRTANVGKPKTILEEARAQLHVSAVPKSLPCREEEFNDIFKFLERKLLDNNSGCIYISGVPGTGKTATVNEAIRCLKKLVSKGELENFDFIEINGMKLSEPRQAYVQILKQVNGQTATWEQAYQILEKRFTRSTVKRPMTLLLVDELDLLCNKRQDVVYNLLDWPAKANAQLVVITIANTMDLPERVLMGRVTSRLGLTRLTFQPYNHRQLQEIVMARLKDSDAFKSEAVQLVARKVAAVSGDARRALDICRRATEIAELNGGKIVTMVDVNQALTEMIASAKVQAIKNCSEMEKIFLQAVCAEVTRTGVEEATFHNVYRQLEAHCSFEGLKVPNITQALGICARLGGNRLLLCEHSRHDTQQRILLNVSSDDIHFAMQTINVA